MDFHGYHCAFVRVLHVPRYLLLVVGMLLLLLLLLLLPRDQAVAAETDSTHSGCLPSWSELSAIGQKWHIANDIYLMILSSMLP